MTSAKLPRRPTLADVAQRAGVSITTVSRMVGGSSKVSDRTRARVDLAMKDLGYFGNAAATQLVSGRTHTIGILTSEVRSFGYTRTIEGIERRAREKGMSTVISIMDLGSHDGIMRTVASVASQSLAGLVVLDFDKYAEPLIQELPSYLPVVTTSGPGRLRPKSHPTVFIDDSEGSRASTQHLISLGHDTVFVVSPPMTDPDEQRTKGILDVLSEARLPSFAPVAAQDWSPASGYQAMLELLDRHGSLVTAVACGNDDLAVGAISAAAERGLRVPEDVSIVGFDNSPVSRHTVPPLTTVEQDFNALGSIAFDRLLELTEDPTGVPLEERLSSSLVLRESTAPPSPARGLRLPEGRGASPDPSTPGT